jgi:hypothetical protein
MRGEPLRLESAALFSFRYGLHRRCTVGRCRRPRAAYLPTPVQLLTGHMCSASVPVWGPAFARKAGVFAYPFGGFGGLFFVVVWCQVAVLPPLLGPSPTPSPPSPPYPLPECAQHFSSWRPPSRPWRPLWPSSPPSTVGRLCPCMAGRATQSQRLRSTGGSCFPASVGCVRLAGVPARHAMWGHTHFMSLFRVGLGRSRMFWPAWAGERAAALEVLQCRSPNFGLPPSRPSLQPSIRGPSYRFFQGWNLAGTDPCEQPWAGITCDGATEIT